MKEIRLGTIGSGFIVHTILDRVLQVEGISLAAVYSRNKEKGSLLASQYGADRIYTDLDGFLSDEEVNTVYIASPNLLHYEQTRKALLSGKNVICEKPFCTKASQAIEMAELAKERGLFLVEAAPTTFLPNYGVLLRELPKIGKVKLVMGNYSQYSSRYDLLKKGEVTNVFDPAFAGGSLMDINFYNIYLNAALFGRPAEAVYTPNRFGDLADTSGVMTLKYDGFVSTQAGAKDTWGVNYFQIEGEDGFIYIKDGSNGLGEIRVVTKTSDELFDLQKDHDRWFYEVQELTRLFLAGDLESVWKRLDITVITAEVIEKARKNAGIFFPGDDE